MLFSFVCTDHENSLPARRLSRPAHVERLKQLASEGRLVIAGPNPALPTTEVGEEGYTGSLIVADFPSLEEAQAWAAADPYIEAGVYAEVSIKPFIQALP